MCTYIHLQGIWNKKEPTTMGMASSQARLLNLTSRMHQIEYKAAKIEAEKLQMANESRRAYLEYQNAMEQTKIQRQTLGKDASIEWKDLTFADLMYGTGEPPASTGATTFGAFFGGTEGTVGAGSINNAFNIYTPDGKILVSEAMEDAFKNSTDADEFARRMGASAPASSSEGSPGVTVNTSGVSQEVFENEINRLQRSDVVIPQEPEVTQPANNINNDDIDFTISRKGKNGSQNSITIPAGRTGQRIKVEDDLHGTKYYTVKTTSEAINITILDNGRLLIEGNMAEIEADDNQKDDIILMGSNNKVSTMNGNDTVRVGIANDSKESWFGIANNSPKYYGNTINTGADNDYVQNLGLNTIIMGEDAKGDDIDVLYDEQDILQLGKDNEGIIYTRPTGVEYSNSSGSGSNLESYIDNSLDWGMQGAYGDCQTLALINSINNQGKFNDYFRIEQVGNNWQVTFLRGDKEDMAPITVTPTDLEKTVKIDGQTVVAKATGDMDISVIEAAFRKAIESDNIYMDQIGNSNNFHEVANVILGIDKGYAISIDKNNTNACQYLLEKYKHGEISNLVFGTSQNKSNQATQLGIYSQHAYSVKSFNDNSITLVNPHDNKDSITLDWDDFYKYFSSAIVYGDAAKEVEDFFGAENISVNQNAYFGAPTSGSGNFEFYCQIYEDMRNGYFVVSEEMSHSTQFLANMLNSGAYLKEFNTKTNEWEDTSIATNTKLQEVQDESGLRKAEAKYEADMRRIDYKDRKFDYDLAALDNERNAIKNEMETLKTVARDNVERTFKLFG